MRRLLDLRTTEGKNEAFALIHKGGRIVVFEPQTEVWGKCQRHYRLMLQVFEKETGQDATSLDILCKTNFLPTKKVYIEKLNGEGEVPLSTTELGDDEFLTYTHKCYKYLRNKQQQIQLPFNTDWAKN